MAAGSSTELPTRSRKRKADASWGLTTEQDVLNLVGYKYLQPTDASKPEDVNGFVRYLEYEVKVRIVDVQPGSLIITVECGSLQKLEELWKDYSAGCVNETAQKFLLTKEILNELGLLQVKLSTRIPDEKYSDCQELLRAFDGECNYFYKYVVPLPLIRVFLPLFSRVRFSFYHAPPYWIRSHSLMVVTSHHGLKIFVMQIRSEKRNHAVFTSVFFFSHSS